MTGHAFSGARRVPLQSWQMGAFKSYDTPAPVFRSDIDALSSDAEAYAPERPSDPPRTHAVLILRNELRFLRDVRKDILRDHDLDGRAGLLEANLREIAEVRGALDVLQPKADRQGRAG